MKVYVASSMLNIAAVRECQAALVAAGHNITHDWTQHEDNPHPEGSDDWVYARDTYGFADFVGVRTADVVVVLNHEACKDTLVELGIALGFRKPVIVVDSMIRHSVFHFLCRCVDSVAEAVSAVGEVES